MKYKKIIFLFIRNINGKIFWEVNYEIVDKKSGKVTTRGITSHCFLSKNGRPVSLKNNMTEYHEKFLECLDKVSDNQ